MKFSKYTIVNEVIMQIVGLFAKLDAENQKLIIKTLQQTMARNRKPEDDDLVFVRLRLAPNSNPFLIEFGLLSPQVSVALH